MVFDEIHVEEGRYLGLASPLIERGDDATNVKVTKRRAILKSTFKAIKSLPFSFSYVYSSN